MKDSIHLPPWQIVGSTPDTDYDKAIKTANLI